MTDSSFTVSFQFNNTPISNGSVCNPLVPAYWAFGVAFFPFLQIIVNGFVLIATFRSRKQLRHNYVYAYVMNALMGNLVFSILSFYNFLNLAFVFERIWSSPEPFRVDLSISQHQSLQQWWAFRSSSSIGIYLLTNANVSALIYGIRGSKYLVGRYAEASSKLSDSITKRRNKAIAIISTIWIGAIAISLAGSFKSCLKNCLCVTAQYDFDYCRTTSFRECSRLWRPVTSNYLLAVAIIWCIEMLFIVIMLTSAFRRSKRISKPRLQDSSTQLDVTVSNSTRQAEESRCSNLSKTSELASTSVKQETHWKKKLSFGCGISNQSIEFLFTLSVVLFVTTFPAMVVVLVDVFSVKPIIPQDVVSVISSINQLYGLLLPIIMIYYMSGLRQAVQGLFLSIKCCTVTVTEQKRPRAT